jgi:phosphohistidine phosphatase
VLCSSALRTRETAELALAAFSPLPRILFEDALYLAGPAALLKRLTQLEESAGAVLVVGHNPGLHELAITLAAPDSPSYRALASGKFPTTARASFAVDALWSALGRARHQLTDYVTVKSLDQGMARAVLIASLGAGDLALALSGALASRRSLSRAHSSNACWRTRSRVAVAYQQPNTP